MGSCSVARRAGRRAAGRPGRRARCWTARRCCWPCATRPTPSWPARCARPTPSRRRSTTGSGRCGRGCAGTLRLSAAGRRPRIVGNGRALEQLPAVAAAFAAGARHRRAGRRDRPGRGERRAGRGGRAGHRPRRDRRGPRRRAPAQVHAALGQVVQRFLDLLDPDGDEPDPTEQRRAVDRPARRRQHHRPLRARRRRRGEVQDHARVHRSQARRGPPGMAHPRPAARRRAWCSGPTSPSPPARRRSCAP